MAELQSIIVFHGRHFVRHLGICYRICVKLLQLMCAVITHNPVKKNDVSILINGWVTANYSVSRPPFCPPSWYFICANLLQLMSGFIKQWKKRSLHINKWPSYGQLYCFTAAILSAILVFVSDLCKPIKIMFCVISSNLEKCWRLYLKPFSWGPQTRHTYTHTHRHTHTHTHTHMKKCNALYFA